MSTEILEKAVGKGSCRPSHVRYGVVGFALALAMVTYLDRVCISTFAKQIMHDLSISEMQMSYVFSAFSLAYALFEIPTASWADRRGTRMVLTRIVAWWSTFTIATAAAINFYWLLLTRFLFGIGEAGAWPSVASTFSRWIPAKDRGTVQGIFFAGAHLSGGLTPLLVMFLIGYFNWRTIFIIFGLAGFVWSTLWYLWYRDDPSVHPKVNREELKEILSGRETESKHSEGWQHWKRLLTDRNMLPLCIMYVGNSYAFYFCITWLPTYLENKFGISKTMLGFYAGMPLILSVLGDLFGGITTDRLSKRFGLYIGRSGLGCTAYLVAGIAMFVAATAHNSTVAIIGISIAVASAMFTLGAAWGTCLDIGGSHAGVVSATMNTASQLGAMCSPILAVYVKNNFGGWSAPLFLMGGLFVIGAICWCFIDPRKRIFE